MKKIRRNYPAYVTNTINREYIATLSRPQAKGLTPLSYALMSAVAVVVMVGVLSVASIARPASSAAAQSAQFAPVSDMLR